MDVGHGEPTDRLPLAGADEQVACSLHGAALRERLRAWRSLPAARERHEGSDRVVAVYEDHPDIRRRLEELVGLEDECCGEFLEFALSPFRDGLRLDITLAPGVPGRVDDALRALAGQER